MAAVTVIHIEAVPDALRGSVSRWMIEPVAGLFVGPLPARVRTEVWRMITRNRDTGRAVIVYPAENEQGYAIDTRGDARRTPIDLDGLTLIAFK